VLREEGKIKKGISLSKDDRDKEKNELKRRMCMCVIENERILNK